MIALLVIALDDGQIRPYRNAPVPDAEVDGTAVVDLLGGAAGRCRLDATRP